MKKVQRRRPRSVLLDNRITRALSRYHKLQGIDSKEPLILQNGGTACLRYLFGGRERNPSLHDRHRQFSPFMALRHLYRPTIVRRKEGSTVPHSGLCRANLSPCHTEDAYSCTVPSHTIHSCTEKSHWFYCTGALRSCEHEGWTCLLMENNPDLL